jgi:hypothetical protein
LPVRVVDFGGNTGYDLADFCNQYKSESLTRLVALSRKPDNAQVESSSTVGESIYTNLARLERFISTTEYMPIPFKSFHKFGGMMKVLHPGKVAIIGAPSGHGKTSLMETWVDSWLQQGFDVLWWGSEWSPMEYGIRRIQRNGTKVNGVMMAGLTVDQFTDYQIWKREEDLGVKPALRYGKKLPPPILARSIQINRKIKKWPGKIWYFPNRPYIEDIQEEMRSMLHRLRRDGRRVACVVWDYLSLMQSRNAENTNNQPQAVLNAVKSFSLETGLATLAGSQVNKDTTRRITSGEKVYLSPSDLYYVREDAANLIIGLNPIYKKMKDEYGVEQWAFDNRARAEILKNSLGKSRGNVHIRANFKHLTWNEL